MLEDDDTNPLAEACNEFGKYLNVSGAAEAASNAILALFLLDKKPDNAVEFVRETLDKKINKELVRLKTKVEVAREEVDSLRDVIIEMRRLGLKLISPEPEEASAHGNESQEKVDGEDPDGEQTNDKADTESLASLDTIAEQNDSANAEDENQ